jgi:hypothetical protein
MSIEYSLSASDAVVAFGGVDMVPLPLPFKCKSCGRENQGVWFDMDDRLVLVCKCGGDDVSETIEFSDLVDRYREDAYDRQRDDDEGETDDD